MDGTGLPPRPGRGLGIRGIGLIELLAFIAILGILMAGMRNLFRNNSLGADLISYTQAGAFAEQLMELRRSRGKGADLREDPEVRRQRYPWPFRVKEESFRETGLSKVTVTVAWKASGNRLREVKLVSLMK